MDALIATIDFLRASGIDPKLCSPLETLYAALLDVSTGRSNDLLKRIDAGPDRSREPHEVERTFIDAMVAIDLCKLAGLSRRVALKTASVSLGFESVKQLENKIENARRGKGISPQAKQHYHALMSSVRNLKLDPEQLKKAAGNAMSNLNIKH